MIKVGITGGMGSGKSTICKFFEILGIPVFIADVKAKEIMMASPVVRENLIAAFGKDIYLPDHSLDRKRLAQLIFNSPALLEKANAIIHPEVRNNFFEWVQSQNTPYIVYEAAILFESGFYKMLDFNILVTAPQQERINRILNRDNTTEEEALKRISQQWTDEEKAKLADYILENNNKELVIPKLIELDKKFRLSHE